MRRGIGTARLLRHALAWAAPLLLAALGFIAAEQYVAEAHRVAEREAGSHLLSDAEALEQNLLRTVEAVEGLHSLAQTRHDLLARGSTEGASAIEDHLRAVATQERFGILQVGMTDAEGMLSWSSVPGWVPISVADREHFRALRDGRRDLFVSAPLLGRVSGKWSVQFARPLTDKDGAFAGVAVVSLDPLLLPARLGAIHFDPNDTATVLRLPDGVLIARSRDAEQKLGQTANPSHPAVAAARAATSGYLRTTNLFDGREVVLAFRHVADVPLLVLVSQDWSVSKAPLDTLQRWVRGACAAALLLGLAATFLLFQMRAARRTRAELDRAQAARTAAEAVREEFARILLDSPAVIYAGERRAGDTDAKRPAHIRFVSPNAARVTGWDAGALMEPDAFVERMDEAGRAERPSFRAGNLRNGGGTMTYRFRRPDGSWMWLREEARVAGTTADGSLRVIGYLTDVTGQRQLEAQAVASAKLATLGEMAAGMAHEMNQPLAIIALAAENAADALRHEGASAIPEALSRLERITRQTDRGRAIVHHLREFSRPGPMKEAGPVALAAILDGALLLTGGALRDAGVEWALDLPAGLPPVSAAEVAAEQVFVNLLLNARDAMLGQPPGHARRIRIRARAEADEVVVTVTDTGGGIAAAAADRLFDPFFTTKPPDKGSGLGLAICHGIMRSLGGSIGAANVPGGAEFLLRFRSAAPAEATPTA